MTGDIVDEVTLKFEDNQVKMRTYTDGAMSLSEPGAEHFIYLYPHQVRLLRAFLEDGAPSKKPRCVREQADGLPCT